MDQNFKTFQTFEVIGGPSFGRANLPKLRAQMKTQGLDGVLIPHEDEYQNEYLPACNERLLWVSGFTGSAGAALVTQAKAVIFVDGRYTLQVHQQVDETLFDIASIEGGGIAKWLAENAVKGEVYGYDPRLHSPNALARLKASTTKRGAELRAVDTNPIDKAWTDRPAPPQAPITAQPLKYAGAPHSEKRAQIAASIAEQGADAAIITSPASIAWLLNIRGADVQCTPLPLSTLIIHTNGHVQLYVSAVKISTEIRAHLGDNVAINDEDKIGSGIKALKGKTVIADPNTASAWFFEALKSAGVTVKAVDDPVALPKACKSDAEINGTTAAHIRDGAALANFLHWLDTQAQSGAYDEIEAAITLEKFRHATGLLEDLSFESISGAGSNGAVVHYRVNQATAQKLSRGTLYLIDSGGQYRDGTTDVTRTVPIGPPTPEMAQRFTLVLKGHIALACARFPEGITGSNLDTLARMPLWQAGLDYDHGTGHGVGVFLGVHEGPQRISKAPNSIALKPGMIVSNEPGYYKAGAYGIRIENLQYVTKPDTIGSGDRKMLGFKTLTLAPIHRALIEVGMLTAQERAYMDRYHASVWEKLSPLVKGDTKAWLKEACAAL